MVDPAMSASSSLAKAMQSAQSSAAYLAEEGEVLEFLLALACVEPAAAARIQEAASALVTAVRNHRREGLDSFLNEYDLSSEEGVLLMVWPRRCCASPMHRALTN